MLNNQNMLSVNQISATIKLCEMWKAKNVEEYPIKFKYQSTEPGARETRGNSLGKMIETGRSLKSMTSYVGDAPIRHVLNREVEASNLSFVRIFSSLFIERKEGEDDLCLTFMPRIFGQKETFHYGLSTLKK